MNSLELFSPLPQSAVVHRIGFFHLDGLQGSGLKEHISPRNKQFSLKLKGNSVYRFRLAPGSSALALFLVGGSSFKYFPMWHEDV